jgi:hypothetical protein
MFTIIYCSKCAETLEKDYSTKKVYFSEDAHCRWCGKLGAHEIECTDRK